MSDPTGVRFRQDRIATWQELETALTIIESNAVARLSDRTLIALPSLYRTAISSLSLARATNADEALRGYLEGLCRRAYFLIYGIDERLGSRAVRFLRFDWNRTARGLLPEFLVCVSLIALGFLAAWAEVARDPESFWALVPAGLAQGRNPLASPAFLNSALRQTDDIGTLFSFAAQLFAHNVQVAFLSVALGFFLCVPSALLMLYNGAVLGALMAVYARHGLALDFAGWMSIHGGTEITAIALAGAAGLRIGRAFILPGQDPRVTSLMAQGRLIAPVVMGTVLMLVGAGLLEGVGRQLIASTALRFATGAATLGFWVWYLFGRRDINRRPYQASR